MQKVNRTKKSASTKTGHKRTDHSPKSANGGNGMSAAEREASLLRISEIFHRAIPKMLSHELPKGKGQLFPIE